MLATIMNIARLITVIFALICTFSGCVIALLDWMTISDGNMETAAFLLVAAIFEEGMFRGFLFEGLRKTQLGDLGALALPTVFWAGMHFAYLPVPIFYPVLLAFGAILCLARLRTGSLIAPIILHSLFNFVQVVLSSF